MIVCRGACALSHQPQGMVLRVPLGTHSKMRARGFGKLQPLFVEVYPRVVGASRILQTLENIICLHMRVALTRGGQIERENPGFWGSGRPRAAGKPLKKVGGFAPHLFEGLPGRPGPPRRPKSRIFPLSLGPPLVPPPCEGI